MTDEEVHDIALVVMAGAWMRRIAADMVPSADKLRLGAQLSALDQKEVGEASAVMLEALAEHIKLKRHPHLVIVENK